MIHLAISSMICMKQNINLFYHHFLVFFFFFFFKTIPVNGEYSSNDQPSRGIATPWCIHPRHARRGAWSDRKKGAKWRFLFFWMCFFFLNGFLDCFFGSWSCGAKLSVLEILRFNEWGSWDECDAKTLQRPVKRFPFSRRMVSSWTQSVNGCLTSRGLPKE